MVDCIIIGAGAAGLMTAITAARLGVKVLLLDSREKIGAKILMSGGTRCNVTNEAVSDKDYNSGDLMRVRNILKVFDNKKTIVFFKEIGVDLVLEKDGDGNHERGRGGKYFPRSNSGKTVLEALMKEATRAGVKLVAPARVTGVQFIKDLYHVTAEGNVYTANKVVLATGGLSYPASGSDGSGYAIAKQFGHGLVATTPALTPFNSTDKIFNELSGISLTITLTLKEDGKKKFVTTDGFLFTHTGYSGPAVLDMSRHYLRAKGKKVMEANFMPIFNDATFTEAIAKTIVEHPKKTAKNFLTQWMPERLAVALLLKARVAPDTVLNQLKKDRRISLLNTCLHYPLEVSGVVGYSKAEVTAGGVNLNQLNPKTLESLHQPGLYFVGEICDVDGRIGGFNFQWAWASGYIAGNAVSSSVSLRTPKG